jgi:hypothetical protein
MDKTTISRLAKRDEQCFCAAKVFSLVIARLVPAISIIRSAGELDAATGQGEVMVTIPLTGLRAANLVAR